MTSAKRFEKLLEQFSKILERKIILSLFDYSGTWPHHYAKAGFRVLQIDLKLGLNLFDFQYRRIRKELVYGILAAPPCTDFTVTGAQYWKKKDRSGQTSKSIALVRKTLEIIRYFNPEFWAIENPVGRLSRLIPELGKPWYFQPYEFGDPWTKKTGLWGRFNLPFPRPVKPKRFSAQGSWTQRLGGKSEKTKELRGLTPPAFAKAFFEANHLVINTRTMKQYEHREFIRENALTDTSFSKPLQSQIRAFNKLLAIAEDTVGEDRDEVQQRLDALDLEILDEMINEYEDQLENNELEDEPPAESKEVIQSLPLTPDEQALEKLHGSRIVRLSDLRNAGFQGDLSKSRIVVGEYLLERTSVFSYEYKISKVSL